MDLARYDTVTGSEEGRWIEPKMNGASVGMRIKVLGPDSRAYLDQKDAIQRDLYQQLASAANGLEPKMADSEDAKESRFYSKLVLDWEPIEETDPLLWEGKPFPFSEANAFMLFQKVPLIRVQVKAYVESRRNFLKPGFGDSASQSGNDSF